MIILKPSTNYRWITENDLDESRVLKLESGEYTGMFIRNIQATADRPLVIEGPDEGVAVFTDANSATCKVYNCQHVVFRGKTNSEGNKTINWKIHLEFEIFSSFLTVDNIEFSELDFRVATISAKTNAPSNQAQLDFLMQYPYRLAGVKYPESHHHHPAYTTNGDLTIKNCLFHKPIAPRTVSGKTGQTVTLEDGSCSKEQLYFGSTKEPSHESGKVTVENCLFVNSGLEAIQVAHARELLIKNNTVINSGIDPTEGLVQQNAVQIGEAEVCRFERNIISGAGQFGIYLQTGTFHASENVICDSAESAIYLGRHKKYAEGRAALLSNTNPNEHHYQELSAMIDRYVSNGVKIDKVAIYNAGADSAAIYCADEEVDIVTSNNTCDSSHIDKFFTFRNRNFNGTQDSSFEDPTVNALPKPTVSQESPYDEYWANLGYGYNANTSVTDPDPDPDPDPEEWVELSIKVKKSQLKQILASL